MISARERTRALNDELRIHHRGGRIVVTPGVKALGAILLPRVDEAISKFDEFDEDSDPHGEHDFGVVEIAGHEIMFKIDYYDKDLLYLSPDPSDVLATGAVLSNFPARGQGKVFLINDIEVATAQLWVRGDQGIKSFEDLKGKRIATAIGTTAHVFLDRALRANKIDPKDVELVNQSMPAAVTAFISGAVPAVALWVPFNITVRDKVPGAVKLADASAYYPQAAIIGGWAARNDYFSANRDVLGKIAKAWAEANDYMLQNSKAALEQLQSKHYSTTPLSDLKEQLQAQKMFSSKEWKTYYADGTVTKWLEQSTDFFMSNAGVSQFTRASEYFEPKIYLDAIA